MLSVLDLVVRFGPPHNVAPWGECVIVQASEFLLGWKAELNEQGHVCHFDLLDGYPAVFVPLGKEAKA